MNGLARHSARSSFPCILRPDAVEMAHRPRGKTRGRNRAGSGRVRARGLPCRSIQGFVSFFPPPLVLAMVGGLAHYWRLKMQLSCIGCGAGLRIVFLWRSVLGHAFAPGFSRSWLVPLSGFFFLSLCLFSPRRYTFLRHPIPFCWVWD
jgi:hypothetical protein